MCRFSLLSPIHTADATQLESRVGSVNAPLGSRGPVYNLNFLCCWAIEVGDKWRRNDAIVEKFINMDQNSRSQTAMESQQWVSKLSTESVGSRRELLANSCTHRRRVATRQLSRVGVGGVYWVLIRVTTRCVYVKKLPVMSVYRHVTCVIAGVLKEDEGMYTCTAENQFGTVRLSAFITVTGIGLYQYILLVYQQV